MKEEILPMSCSLLQCEPLLLLLERETGKLFALSVGKAQFPLPVFAVVIWTEGLWDSNSAFMLVGSTEGSDLYLTVCANHSASNCLVKREQVWLICLYLTSTSGPALDVLLQTLFWNAPLVNDESLHICVLQTTFPSLLECAETGHNCRGGFPGDTLARN